MPEPRAVDRTATATASAHPRRWLAAAGLALLLAAVAWVGLRAPHAPQAEALPTLSLAQLLHDAPAAGWRVVRLQGHPRLLVIEFPDLLTQARALNRAATLFEQPAAPRDRVLDDTELAALIAQQSETPETFYYGHDHEAQNLQRFFELARRQGIALTAQERQLESLLRTHGMLAQEGPAAARAPGPTSVLITFTRAQPGTDVDAAMRASVARHELSHGVYFTSTAYADHCRRFWRERLSPAERGQFVAYLARRGYDPLNEDLMINETQAFLMHSPDPRAFSATDLGVDERTLASMRRRFAEGAPNMVWAALR